MRPWPAFLVYPRFMRIHPLLASALLVSGCAGMRAQAVNGEINTARSHIPSQIGVDLEREQAALSAVEADLARARAELGNDPASWDSQKRATADLDAAEAELAAARAGWESAATWMPLDKARQAHRPVSAEEVAVAEEKANAFAAVGGERWAPFVAQHRQAVALLRRYAGGVGTAVALPDDLSRPVTKAVDVPRSKDPVARVELSVGSHKARTFAVHVLGCSECTGIELWKLRNGAQVARDRPATLRFEVPPGAHLTFVFVEQGVTQVGAKDLYGAPPKDAPLEGRDLTRYALFARKELKTTPPPSQVLFASEVFSNIDPAFLAYATTAGKCALVPNEPVLPFSVGWDPNSKPNWYLLRANGQACLISTQGELSDFATTIKPATIAMPPYAEPDWKAPQDDWSPEEFLADAPSNPKIAKYQEAKAKAWDCAEKQWKKLDPSGAAQHYDVITTNLRTGNAKVENLYDKLNRQVTAACKLEPLWKTRDGIRAEYRASFEKAEKGRLEAVAKALAGK